MVKALRRIVPVIAAILVLGLTASIASADGPGWKTISQDFHGLLFGLNVGQNGQLLVADSGAGPTKLDPDSGETSLLASLPNVTDVIQVGRREYMALTGGGDPQGPTDARLWRIKDGVVTEVADLGKFEADHDPDGAGVDSNPYHLAKLSRNKILVADAGGNDILIVDKDGNIDWVAVLPPENLAVPGGECPAQPPDSCSDAVATGVAVGPDGAIYAGELKGVPATPGTSRVWRIEPDARHVTCGSDDDSCTLVETPPFTSIVDMTFGKDGTAYVVELDEASWLAAEGGQGAGGTVNACKLHNGGGDDEGDRRHDNGDVAFSCKEIGTGLPFPLAAAASDGSVYVTLALGPEGPVEVAVLTNGNEGDNGGEDNGDGNGDHGGNANGDNEGRGNDNQERGGRQDD